MPKSGLSIVPIPGTLISLSFTTEPLNIWEQWYSIQILGESIIRSLTQ